MLKADFLYLLKRELSGISRKEKAEHLAFYNEMIDDLSEELGEEAAVAEIGSPRAVAEAIFAERPKAPSGRRRGGELTLLLLGSPIWLSLVIAALAVAVSLYAALLSVFISLWAVTAALLGGLLGGLIGGIILLFRGAGTPGVALLGGGLAAGGLSLLCFFLCRTLSLWLWLFTKKITVGILSLFHKKGENQ